MSRARTAGAAAPAAPVVTPVPQPGPRPGPAPGLCRRRCRYPGLTCPSAGSRRRTWPRWWRRSARQPTRTRTPSSRSPGGSWTADGSVMELVANRIGRRVRAPARARQPPQQPAQHGAAAARRARVAGRHRVHRRRRRQAGPGRGRAVPDRARRARRGRAPTGPTAATWWCSRRARPARWGSPCWPGRCSRRSSRSTGGTWSRTRSARAASTRRSPGAQPLDRRGAARRAARRRLAAARRPGAQPGRPR